MASRKWSVGAIRAFFGETRTHPADMRTPCPYSEAVCPVDARFSGMGNSKGKAVTAKPAAPSSPAAGKWAKNLTDLGAAMNPPRERAWLSEQKKHPKCPGQRQNGSYNIALWQKFVDDHCGLPRDKTPESNTARRVGIDLDNELKRIKLEQARGDSIHVDDTVQVLGKMMSEFDRALTKLCGQISSQLVGMGTPGQVEKRLKKAMRDVLTDFSSVTPPETEDAKKKAFWNRLCAEWSGRRTKLLSGSGLNDM